MKREFIDYVQDILDAIDKIEEFTAGMSFGTVWRTVNEDLPALKPIITQILQEIKSI